MKYLCNTILFIALSHFVTQLAAAATPVTTKKLADVLFYPVRDAPATTLSLNDTRVSTELKGILKGINVRVGDSVKQGDIVANMECEDYEIAVVKAKAKLTAQRATLKFDRSQLKKVTKLSKKKNISAEEVERRTSNAAISAADVAGLKASLEATERAVNKCSIRAPFDAVVISKLANHGDYLVPGSPVLRLLDRDNVEVSAKVQEKDLELLQQAENVAFIANDKRYPLVLRAVLPLMESRIRSYEVRLEFATENKAYPGSAGRTEWRTPSPFVPAELLVRRKGLGIFLAVDGHAEFVPIASASAGQPALAETLSKDSAIIINGRFKINDGDVIRVVEP